MKRRTRCPGCGNKIKGTGAISRYDYGDICSNCGLLEAILGDFITERITKTILTPNNTLPPHAKHRKNRKS